MLQVVTGPFHPHLENALVNQIRAAKASDPFSPLALVTPSAELLTRLRQLLVREASLPLLNVHFLTFHQLALRLWDESRLCEPADEPIASLQFVDDLFFEQLVQHIVQSRLSTLEPLRRVGYSTGTWGALWATVRDLKDAGVDPAVALRAVAERQFEEDDAPWLEALFTLQAAVIESSRVMQVGTRDDLAESLAPFTTRSRFLGGLRQVFYYGFYDLTQIQLSFFEAVIKTVPATLFFPLDHDSSFAFAQRFFDRYVQPLAPSTDALTLLARPEPRTGKVPQEAPELHVRSVVGVEEELASACREMLDLVETNGYQFDEIGLVARTLDPYLADLQPIFDRHRIPFTSAGEQPLIQEPHCKVLLQLAALPVNGFYRTAVLDVVTSPLYRVNAGGRSGVEARPDLWRLAVQALHITRGEEEWARLADASRSELLIEGDDDAEGGTDRRLGIDPHQLRLLWEVVSRLLTDCRNLPQRGPVRQLLDSFMTLATTHLRRPDETDPAATNKDTERILRVWQAIDQVVTRLRQLDAIETELTWEDFASLMTRAIERTSLPIGDEQHRGVRVMDAMAARGLPFKALFILGLNEKVFPRYIREDAFLRDRHRRVLDATLGFKIDEKLLGYDEEPLLFHLLCRSAGRRLYLSYQRADEAGRALAPSGYIAEARRRFGFDPRQVDSVPRRLTDRLAQRPRLRSLVPPAELALWVALNGQDPAPLLEVAGQDAVLFRHGWDALERIEDDSPTLGAYDGLTGSLNRHWASLAQRGLAPTPLERYARCPFQYFANNVLRLESIRQPIEQGLDAQLLGTLCHAALRRCYERLTSMGWPDQPVTPSSLSACIASSVEEASAECEATHRTGYFLLWKIARELVAGLVTAVVEAGLADYREQWFKPVAFEVEAEGQLDGLGSADQPAIKIHGRVDRVDQRQDPPGLRIVDYKFKIGSSMKQEDRNLLQSALRGFRLQPPLYSKLIMPGQPSPGEVLFLFLAPNWETPIARSTFDASAWQSSLGPRLRSTLTTLIDGIKAGRYFILPDGYCDHCEFSVACRRYHGPTWWRAYRAAPAKDLKALRKQQVKDE